MQIYALISERAGIKAGIYITAAAYVSTVFCEVKLEIVQYHNSVTAVG